MVTELNKSELRRWFAELWNDRREALIDELMQPDARVYGIDDTPTDREGFRRGYHSFLEAFPDLRVTVDEVLAEGDKSVAHITCVGTHLGQGLGIPPSGRSVAFTAMTLTTWRDGKIAEGRNVIDMSAVYRQVLAEKPGSKLSATIAE